MRAHERTGKAIRPGTAVTTQAVASPNRMIATRIDTLVAVNGLAFGSSGHQIVAIFGQPDNAMYNYTGEYEMLFTDSIYRTVNDRLVEVTVPDDGHCIIDSIPVLNVFDWLSGIEGTVDRARFRISKDKGIAYDYRNLDRGSITVFERGRWEALL